MSDFKKLVSMFEKRAKNENDSQNGKKKEYANGKLIYDGEYSHGKRHGKGKEYADGNLIYDGEFLNGKRSGKGKEYKNKKLIYEGHFLNGKRNGKGKEFNDEGILIYEGEYSNGVKKETEKKSTENGLSVHNITNVNNSISRDRGANYERYEKFKEKNGNLIYKEYNCLNGQLEYEGEYSNAKWNGIGKKYYKNKLNYIGDYSNGKRNGKGEEYNYNGKLIFEGEYLNGKMWNGKGFDDKGNVVYELKDGKGKVNEYDFFNGQLIFTGEYLNGERNGKGKV